MQRNNFAGKPQVTPFLSVVYGFTSQTTFNLNSPCFNLIHHTRIQQGGGIT